MATFSTTKVFKDLVEAAVDNRYLILYGGSSSSKTISVLQYLVLYALKYPNKRITLTSESIPVMKKTLIADLKDVVMQEAWKLGTFNKSDLTYIFPNGSVFNFVPADEESRFKGPRQDIFYSDEVNHIPERVYDQADIRTKDLVISSFNPTSRFWLADRFENDKTFVHHSTVLDNPFVSPNIIEALKSRAAKDPNFYKVYFLGEWGNLEGLVFEEGRDWDIVESMPRDFDKRVLAVDFGYSIDPTAIIDIRYFRGELWAREIEYKTGLVNSDIAYLINKTSKVTRVVADSAEPKSIEEIHRLGIDIHPSQKGRDSINHGINLLKEFKLNVTKDSVNLIKELRNYSWAKDKDGNMLNKPIDDFNHTIDALRYGVWDMLNKKIITFI